MKGSIILKTLVGLLLVALLPKLSLADGGKPSIVFRKTLMNSIQDTLPPLPAQTAVNKDEKKVNTIKVLPNPHRQPVPVPVKVTVPQVKIIKPVVKPVIKILH
ncbi:MAG: hypothetical protein ACTHK0_10525 [Ginsengibacter sp.]